MPTLTKHGRVCSRSRPWLSSVLALAFCALVVANWLAPVGFRIRPRSVDSPGLFGALCLLSVYAFTSGRRLSSTWQRLSVSSLSAIVCVLAVPTGCASFVFRLDALPVADIAVRSDRVVAYWMAGGAFGPHYTEFRQERAVLPGIVLARVLGYSPNIGSVTLSVSSGGTVTAVTTDDGDVGAQTRVSYPVTPLLPW